MKRSKYLMYYYVSYDFILMTILLQTSSTDLWIGTLVGTWVHSTTCHYIVSSPVPASSLSTEGTEVCELSHIFCAKIFFLKKPVLSCSTILLSRLTPNYHSTVITKLFAISHPWMEESTYYSINHHTNIFYFFY